MPTYEIKNEGARPQAFRVKGGTETVKSGATRLLDLADEYPKEQIDALKERGITVSAKSGEAENPELRTIGKPLGQRVGMPAPAPAKDPAETGGVVSQSSKSEVGGVARKSGDTTTTTKPTEKQTGPVA